MPHVQLTVEVSPELLQRYREEAERQGDTAEHLLEHTVKVLLEDMEEEEREPPDTPLAMP
jgi:hypothetical protein